MKSLGFENRPLMAVVYVRAAEQEHEKGFEL
jgi:hypothetical protein